MALTAVASLPLTLGRNIVFYIKFVLNSSRSFPGGRGSPHSSLASLLAPTPPKIFVKCGLVVTVPEAAPGPGLLSVSSGSSFIGLGYSSGEITQQATPQMV